MRGGGQVHWADRTQRHHSDFIDYGNVDGDGRIEVIYDHEGCGAAKGPIYVVEPLSGRIETKIDYSKQASTMLRTSLWVISTWLARGWKSVSAKRAATSICSMRRARWSGAVSAADGRSLSEMKLASPPVFDGTIAAGGRLYVSRVDGSLVCLAEEGVK